MSDDDAGCVDDWSEDGLRSEDDDGCVDGWSEGGLWSEDDDWLSGSESDGDVEMDEPREDDVDSIFMYSMLLAPQRVQMSFDELTVLAQEVRRLTERQLLVQRNPLLEEQLSRLFFERLHGQWPRLPRVEQATQRKRARALRIRTAFEIWADVIALRESERGLHGALAMAEQAVIDGWPSYAVRALVNILRNLFIEEVSHIQLGVSLSVEEDPDGLERSAQQAHLWRLQMTDQDLVRRMNLALSWSPQGSMNLAAWKRLIKRGRKRQRM